MEDPVNARLCALIRMVEEAEEASREAREKAERDRDYVDGKQLTREEHEALEKRGQPPIAFNVIRARVDFHQGLEKKQRRDPKAWPRNNPADADAADAFTDAMRYVMDETDYPSVRSAVWRNVTVEGFGGLELWAETGARKAGACGCPDIRMSPIPWDRLLVDPHSARPDFSDAAYLGQVLWLDIEDAVARYRGLGKDEAEVRQILEATLERPAMSETYDDKPAKALWADPARKRVRVVVLWKRGQGGWSFHEFTRAGVLAEGPSPYRDEDGKGWCPLILETCFIDRERARYGLVRDMIDPQDEINKRRSKSLHLLTMRGVLADEGAVDNVAEAKRQLAKPDFWIQKAPGTEVQIVTSADLAAGQTQLLGEAMTYLMQSGPNAALLGKGTEDQSGRAIEMQQGGGLIEYGDLMDTLRRLDRRVFRAVALMIKQFWTAEKWIRVTDDEAAPRWVGLNVPQVMTAPDPATGTMRPVTDPWTGRPVVTEVRNRVAELDLDIIVSDAPDVVTLDSENYRSVLQLLADAPGLPPPVLKIMIEMHPGLTARRKRQLSEVVDGMGVADYGRPHSGDAEFLSRGAETNGSQS